MKLKFIEDANGDLVEIEAYCDGCAPVEAHAWPGYESDSDTHCHMCNTLLLHGLEPQEA